VGKTRPSRPRTGETPPSVRIVREVSSLQHTRNIR